MTDDPWRFLKTEENNFYAYCPKIQFLRDVAIHCVADLERSNDLNLRFRSVTLYTILYFVILIYKACLELK
jgi:hypothetical protein